MSHLSRRFAPAPFQPALSRREQRAAGAYYTPPEIVRLIVDLTLGPLPTARRAPRVLDLACGAGEFAVEAVRSLRAIRGADTATHSILAIDIDPQAVATTRRRLTEMGREFAFDNVLTADTLTTDALRPASFDVIIGNPPYVNIRQLAKSVSGEYLELLRQEFVAASGNFDLYVLFIERAIELLAPGGRCGLIVPNKWATLDYARPCRELLLTQTTIEHVIDLSDAKVFQGASVFPHILVFQKNPARDRHEVEYRQFSHCSSSRIPQSSLSAAAIHLTETLDVESRVSMQPLGVIAKLSCGTAGYAAQATASHLREADHVTTYRGNEADFITSGNIDRYAIRLGNVRYMNRDYARPRLSLECCELTLAKRRLFAEPKIVIAGMSRRLEAAWDDHGLALGVQVFAASECQLDPFLVLALLNSKLLSYLFATRYAAKRLSGGYLAINKGQIAQLPICSIEGDRRRQARMTKLARLAVQRCKVVKADKALLTSLDSAIDRIVYELYCLSDAEVNRVESHFDDSAARAA